MRSNRKFLSMLLAIVLVMSVCVPCFAEEIEFSEDEIIFEEYSEDIFFEEEIVIEAPAEEVVVVVEAPVEEIVVEEPVVEEPVVEEPVEEVVEEPVRETIDCDIRIDIKNPKATYYFGDKITFKAKVSGCEGISYKIIWEYNDNDMSDKIEWEEAGSGNEFSYEITQENVTWQWRAVVVLAD